jgi:biotin carboxylase
MMTRTYRARAFLAAAEGMGIDLVAGSEIEQSLSAANPAGHLTLDFSQPESAADKIQEFARRHPLDAIIPADDDGVVIAAMASHLLGLRHNPVSAVREARDKFRMRIRLAEAGVPGPEFRKVFLDANAEAAALSAPYPCVLKPMTLSASRGVIRADNPNQFLAALERINRMLQPDQDRQRESPILVESYMPGAEIALEGVLEQGVLRVLAIYDKPEPMDGPFFEETIYVTPSRHPDSDQTAMAECAHSVAAALGLTEGPIHAEMRLTPDGPRILEIAPRSIGGHCSRTLRFGDGMTLEELLLRHALDLPGKEAQREPGGAGVMMIPIPRAGLLERVEGKEAAEAVPGVEEVELSIPVGQEVIPPPEGSRYLGFIFADLPDPEAVEQALRESHERLKFTISPQQ